MARAADIDYRLQDIFDRMLARYGEQHWWPADTPFEMMVGAVLTQATAWTNVEIAIARLKDADALSPAAIRGMDTDTLAALIYSSGFYNAKARKLKALAQFLGEAYDDNIDAMRLVYGAKLRRELLGVKGIGEETADAILLYALGKPSFVIDAYTRRLISRLGIAPESEAYSAYQKLFSDNLQQDTAMFAEYHALIVQHGKEACRKTPVCEGCCLRSVCPTGRVNTAEAEAARCP
jgi:endonuclease-3 related protein